MRLILWILILGVFGLFVAGCYTVLVHPQVEATGEESAMPRNCSDCHQSADYYYWHYPYNWYWNNSYWRPYYCEPWWWDDYWYWKDDGAGEPVEKGQRHFWQPRVTPQQPSPSVVPGTNQPTGGDNKSSGTDKDKGDTQKKGEETKKHLWEPRKPPEKPQEDKKDEGSTQKSPDEKAKEE